MDAEKEALTHRCLGNDCEVMLPAGVFFCPACGYKKDSARISKTEGTTVSFRGLSVIDIYDDSGTRVIRSQGGMKGR